MEGETSADTLTAAHMVPELGFANRLAVPNVDSFVLSLFRVFVIKTGGREGFISRQYDRQPH